MNEMILAGIPKEQAIEICEKIIECRQNHVDEERRCCFCGKSGDIWYSRDWCSTCQEEYCECCTAWEHNIGKRPCHNKTIIERCNTCALEFKKTTFDLSFDGTQALLREIALGIEQTNFLRREAELEIDRATVLRRKAELELESLVASMKSN